MKMNCIMYFAVAAICLSMMLEAQAQQAFTQYEKIVFGCYSQDEVAFQNFAEKAKDLGATHVTITAEDLPIAYHNLSPPEDPYPAWIITNPGLLQICPPRLLEPYLSKSYGEKILDILKERDAIARKLDMKTAFHTFEPQALPDTIFSIHPSWRGPQVDNPLRSRRARFAPSMTQPEIRDLYAESINCLISSCPSIDILQMRTNDSGAGIEWSEGLYAGPNGSASSRHLDIEERISNYLSCLQDAAKAAGGHLDVHLYNSKEDRPKIIAQYLRNNMAIDNFEGPAGSSFKSQVGSLLYYRRSFAPVPGIPWPVTFLYELEKANERKAERLFINIGDRLNKDLYLNLYKAFVDNPTNTRSARFALLRKLATDEVGEEYAEELVSVWLSLYQAEKKAELLSMGGSVFILGPVHQRWLTRPFVPFPDSLGPGEKSYYRDFQFQARTEVHANDLLDLQGSRLINGFGGYRIASRVLGSIQGDINTAQRQLKFINAGLKGKKKEQYAFLDIRLRIFGCLIRNVNHAMHYQVVLDRAFERNPLAEKYPSYHFIKPVDIKSRQELKRIARAEMDNITKLINLLNTDSTVPLMDLADSKAKEYHRLLGPDLITQLRKKLTIMEKHWEDYKYIWAN